MLTNWCSKSCVKFKKKKYPRWIYVPLSLLAYVTVYMRYTHPTNSVYTGTNTQSVGKLYRGVVRIAYSYLNV